MEKEITYCLICTLKVAFGWVGCVLYSGYIMRVPKRIDQVQWGDLRIQGNNLQDFLQFMNDTFSSLWYYMPCIEYMYNYHFALHYAFSDNNKNVFLVEIVNANYDD